MSRLLSILLGLLLLVPAVAASLDGRGWSRGSPSKNAGRVLSGMPQRPAIDLPSSLVEHLADRTLLVYFSPGCPHCEQAQPELNALSERLGERAKVIGIASGRATDAQVGAYRVEYDVPYQLIRDADRRIASAMGVRGTPSALLVEKQGDRVVVRDGWYPYQRGQDTLIEIQLRPDNPWAPFDRGEYHGNATCGACHLQEMQSWLLTHHSVAWASLVEDGDQDDPSCNGCHVTGKGEGGWSGDPHSPLVDVGCESCHGPGGPHDGVKTEPESTCEGCHDAKHSIAFSYAKGLPHLDHYAAVGLSEQQFYDRRKALVEGTAERHLLSFDSGVHVGSAACAECHQAAHDDWSAGPHGEAMASLHTAEAREHHPDPAGSAECVQCHATQQEAGPPPPSLGGYRLQEGVGCESCHGPGKAHVEAEGGTDNIEGLGDDCPVCVLEAVCTRCHTAEWDPEWELDTRLLGITHDEAAEADASTAE